MKSYKIILFTPLRRRLLEVLEERRPLLVLLDAGKHHLRALDEFLGVREPLVHRLVVPRHAAPGHGAAEPEARRRAGRPPEDAVQIRALLVRAAGLDRVALAAPAGVRSYGGVTLDAIDARIGLSICAAPLSVLKRLRRRGRAWS